LVRLFYYDMLSRRERRKMHQLAAEYYEEETDDLFRAALHYEHAEMCDKAIEFVTKDLPTLVNQGYSRALRKLLERVTEQQLSAEWHIPFQVVRGQIYTFFRESELARTYFELALTQLNELPSTDALPEISLSTDQLKGRAYYGLADVLVVEVPSEAVAILQQGLATFSEKGTFQEAMLLIKMGDVQIGLGYYDEAATALQSGLALLSAQPSHLRAVGLLNLGIVSGHQGDYDRQIDLCEEALTISNQIQSHFLTTSIEITLGAIKQDRGDWAGCQIHYQHALDLAKKVGSKGQITELQLNLGVLKLSQGEHTVATEMFQSCLQAAQMANQVEVVVISFAGMIEINLRQGNLSAAETYLKEAQALVEAQQLRPLEPEIYRGWSVLHRQRNDKDAALVAAEKSLATARDLGDDYEIGVSLRRLGQVHMMTNQIEVALTNFEESEVLLEDIAPYEAAQTQLAWGNALLDHNECKAGETLRQTAAEIFKSLGAKYDLGLVKAVLDAD
ncbi:MAG: tetratricopeptide repeat protein, partial [Chloroflexota bacterium]